MPHDTDPFADLFGKLPDPRTRSTGDGAGPTAGRDAPAPRRADEHGTDPVPSPTGQTPASADPPLTRRQARRTPDAGAESPIRADEPKTTASPGESASASTPAITRPPAPATPSRGSAATASSSPAAAEQPARAARSSTSTATLEDLFAREHSGDEMGSPPRAPRRRRRVGMWIALALVLVVVGGVAAGGLWVWNTYESQIRAVMGWEEPKDFEPGMANGEAFVTIASGDSGGPISQSLFEAGVTKTPGAFYDYLIATAQNPPFQPGVYALQRQMTSEAALEALLNPENKMEDSAQLPEGLTVEQSLTRLADGTGIPLEEFQAAVADPSAYGVPADTLEGWLFPATYTFDPGTTAPQIIQRLVDRTVQSLDSAGVPVEDREEILTIASIIQREARFEADMQKVSRVIQNRLDPTNQETFGLLQMDSTAQYGYGEMHAGSASTSAEAQFDDNPWNTYVRTGLPVGPIANPGDVAIAAALNPADGDWLYFVTVNLDSGETVFTNNLADHNAAVAQWQAWCRDNPDSGC